MPRLSTPHHQVAELCDVAVPEHPRATPPVEHCLSGGLAVDEEQHRVLARRIEIRRVEHPGVELQPRLDLYPDEFHRGEEFMPTSCCRTAKP